MNQYLTAAEADQILAGRADAEKWNTLTEEQKNTLLAHASHILDAGIAWKGNQANAGQDNQWPRKNIAADGCIFPDNEIPVQIKRAAAEQALFMHSGKYQAVMDAINTAAVSADALGINFSIGKDISFICKQALIEISGLGTLKNVSGSSAASCGECLRG